MIKTFFKYFELAFWVSALIALAFADPNNQSHFSLCTFRLMGIKWCPGCGIGHAIAFLLHTDVKASLRAHWLGIPALAGILYRIYVLVRLRFYPQAAPWLNSENK